MTSTDTADVVVIHPSILIEKDTATQTVVTGSTATFTIKVTNTGDSTLTGVHVGDVLTPDCARTSAQLAGNATLTAGASFTYQCTTAALTQGFTNSATATGTPAAGPDVTSTDTADVVVLHPAIKIEKDPATQTIVSGATATFTIKVTNTGDTTLTGVNVVDLLTPDCARTSAQLAGNATLLAGASFTYQCTTVALTQGFTNSATATGTPPLGPPVTSTDTADVVVIHPSILVEKTPDTQTVVTGSTVTFTIKVTNTGDVTLTNVNVADAQAPGCAKAVGTLTAGQSTQYDCTLPNVTANLRTAPRPPARRRSARP